LIPVIASGARAFVSTANKTLQTQLWEKDIPTLQQVCPQPFTAALLKAAILILE
jgi:ATP-dependent DNA helicase DinG